jgi:protein-L-isoaspartate(D-aspartate) O-methyltransferase
MNIDKIIGSGLTSLASREKLIDELKRLGIKNSEVMNLISHMPRHLFIDTALANRAYENVSLPIGFKQTISQPYMVARMTELIHETDSMIMFLRLEQVQDIKHLYYQCYLKRLLQLREYLHYMKNQKRISYN